MLLSSVLDLSGSTLKVCEEVQDTYKLVFHLMIRITTLSCLRYRDLDTPL